MVYPRVSFVDESCLVFLSLALCRDELYLLYIVTLLERLKPLILRGFVKIILISLECWAYLNSYMNMKVAVFSVRSYLVL